MKIYVPTVNGEIAVYCKHDGFTQLWIADEYIPMKPVFQLRTIQNQIRQTILNRSKFDYMKNSYKKYGYFAIDMSDELLYAINKKRERQFQKEGKFNGYKFKT